MSPAAQYRYRCRHSGTLLMHAQVCDLRRRLAERRPHDLGVAPCRDCPGAEKLENPIEVDREPSAPLLRPARAGGRGACDEVARPAGAVGPDAVRNQGQTGGRADTRGVSRLPEVPANGRPAAPARTHAGASGGAPAAASALTQGAGPASPAKRRAAARRAARTRSIRAQLARHLGRMLRGRMRRQRAARRAGDHDQVLQAAQDVEDLARLLATLVGG